MIPVLSGSSEWFAQRNLEYLFFLAASLSPNESFPTRSLQKCKKLRNPTQIVIYFDGRKSLTFL